MYDLRSKILGRGKKVKGQEANRHPCSNCVALVNGPRVVAGALRRLCEKAEIAQIVESPHGAKYIINGELESPQGKRSMVRMIWIVDSGHDEPRLVTVYPQKG